MERGLESQEILHVFTTETVTFPGGIWPLRFKCKDGTTFLAGIFISLTEETVKYRRQVKIVQTVQRETVAT